ncbi:glycosyltransferase family 4 protein [Stakelama pacifica]|uniref:Glycosyltransferase involved in cell wall biosynthesis n=1 Tax=Stakelama pacifica TaxID=517720 RepID=A0A4R6FY39_9SPHN|nr:glycosyltransferase family 4 protein [Stakelama pacifica]TDN86861.1 glycosyltransferase involved in cell wall biosynthesis [Stakelama pacifica]GGO90897.1 glycosyl transferase [Stakelama pacifica]
MSGKAQFHLMMTADAVGGVWQYALEIARTVSESGGRVTLAVLGPAPDAEQRDAARRIARLDLVDTGLPLDWLCEGPEPVEKAGSEIARLARRIAPDLVQLNSPALYGEGRFGVPVVAVAHGCLPSWWSVNGEGDLPPAMRWHRALMRRGLTGADAVIAPSQSFAALLADIYDLPVAPMAVHNGRRMGKSVAVREPHDCALTAGRLWDRAKNIRLLDTVAGRLSFPFHAAGSDCGPHGERIAVTHLHALGSLSDEALAEQLARRPVFVSAARFEPFGLAVLEAAAAGCPLVLSDIPTFRELWDGAALFAAAGDADGFAAAIEQAVTDQGLRGELGKAAEARAQAYSAEAMGAKMMHIFAGLTRRRAAA